MFNTKHKHKPKFRQKNYSKLFGYLAIITECFEYCTKAIQLHKCNIENFLFTDSSIPTNRTVRFSL